MRMLQQEKVHYDTGTTVSIDDDEQQQHQRRWHNSSDDDTLLRLVVARRRGQRRGQRRRHSNGLAVNVTNNDDCNKNANDNARSSSRSSRSANNSDDDYDYYYYDDDVKYVTSGGSSSSTSIPRTSGISIMSTATMTIRGGKMRRQKEQQQEQEQMKYMILLTRLVLYCFMIHSMMMMMKVSYGQETETSSSHEELEWIATCDDSDYDFVSTLLYCQNGNIYGYRISEDVPCGTLAPLIRMTAGFRYRLRFINQSTRNTNIHTHGLHIPGDGNGDDSTRLVPTNQWIVYNWTIPVDHMDGTYWYHSHYHPDSERQMGGGAMGMLLIDRSQTQIDQQPARPNWVNRERKILIYDIPLGIYTNGINNAAETVELSFNVWHRLRVVYNNIAGNVWPLLFDSNNCQVHVAAYDGVWRTTVPNPTPSYSYDIVHASRLDFVIKCTANSTMNYGENGDIVLINFNIVNNNATAQEDGDPESWISTRPNYLRDLRNEPGIDFDTWVVFLTSNSVNFVIYDPTTPLNNFEYNTIQQWSIDGITSRTHPFHIHLFHMQIITQGGCGRFYEYGEYYDTIQVNFNGCRVRFQMIDIAGSMLMHCHRSTHTDDGSINWVRILNGSNDTAVSYIDYNPQDISTFPIQDPDTICTTITDEPTSIPTTLPTTTSPTTIIPTTVSPTTIIPTTLVPTTVSPTVSPTFVPTTISPTLKPTTITPTVSPTTLAPTTVSPTTSTPSMKAATPIPTTSTPTTGAPVVAGTPTLNPTLFEGTCIDSDSDTQDVIRVFLRSQDHKQRIHEIQFPNDMIDICDYPTVTKFSIQAIGICNTDLDKIFFKLRLDNDRIDNQITKMDKHEPYLIIVDQILNSTMPNGSRLRLKVTPYPTGFTFIYTITIQNQCE